MTDQHSEKILAAIEEALGKINQIDGYYYTLERIQRYDRKDTKIADRPCATLERVTEVKNLRGSDQWDCDLVVEVEAEINEEELDEVLTTDRALANLQDDIERALAEEVDWAALDAWLSKIEVSKGITGDPENPLDDVIVRLTIRYAHAINNTRLPLSPY